MSNLYHADEMEAKGYTIDHHCYPWVAYKGPRFNPTEWFSCYTKLESELIRERDMRRRYARAYLDAQDRNLREAYGDPCGRERPETD